MKKIKIDKNVVAVCYRGLIGMAIIIGLGFFSSLELKTLLLLLFIPVALTIHNLQKLKKTSKNNHQHLDSKE